MGTRTTTVLFTDTEASTELTTALGDEATMTLLHVHERIVVEAASAHGGLVVKNTGDGFLVLFSSCAGGIAGALDIRDRLAEHNAARPDAPLRVRIGLNVGQVIEDRGDVHGLVITIAARVTAKARTGQVLVPDAVRVAAVDDAEATGEDWTFVDRGLFWLKGLREQWRLHEVTHGEPVEPAPAIEGRTPFVGRDAERAALRRHVDEANEGRGRLVVVVGPSGAGKTRLVEEVGTEAQERGLRFLVGRSHESGEHDPYLPLIEVVERVERALTPAAFRDLLGDAAPDVARIVPDLRRRHADLTPAADTPAHQERRQLFVSMREVLARLAATRPLVILLDDLHWADEPSLLLVEHLASQLPTMPVLLVATYSPEELTTARPLHRVLMTLLRRRLATSIPLAAFTGTEVADFLTAIAGSPPPRALVDTLVATTAGNAFFLDEVTRDLIGSGLLRDDGSWRAGTEHPEVAVPESVRLLLRSRLDSLGPATRKVLSTASLLGHHFGFELLGRCTGLPEDDLLDAVDEAERGRFMVSSIEAGEARLAFSHDLIQRTLVDEVSPARRQRLHLRIADAIEALHADSLEEHAVALVHHLEAAGTVARPRRALPHLVVAGERALQSAAYDEALHHLRRADELVPADDHATRARVLEGMGTAERSLGHLDEALELWGRALDLHEASGDMAAVARLCLDAAVQVAWWRRGGDVVRLVDRGLGAVGDLDSPLAGGLKALAGRLASQSGDHDRGEQLLREALRTAHGHTDARILGIALSSQAIHHFAYCQYHDTVSAGTQAIEHLRRVGDTWDLANVLGYVGASLGWLGRFEEAAEVGEEGEALATRLGNWSAYVFAEQAQGFRAIGTRPAPVALQQRGEHALELAEGLGFPWLVSIGHTRIGLAAFWRGDWAEALARFEKSARLEVRGAAGGHLGRLILVHAYLGNHARSLELIAEARGGFPMPGHPASGTAWALAATAVEAFFMVGAHDEAAALYETTVALARTGGLMRTWDYRLVATLQGMAAAAAGEWTLSEGHFEDALRLARELPMSIEEPEAWRFYSAMLLARDGAGDRERAAHLLGRAATAYRDLGMPRHESLALGEG